MASRIYSVYLDSVEEAAVRKIARANHVSPNAVIRAHVRTALGLPAIKLEIPAEVAAWADAQSAAAEAAGQLA